MCASVCVLVLAEELKSYGIQDVFVFCTRGELSKYRVPNLLDLYQQSGIVTHHHPIPDGGTPDIGSCWGIMEELATCLKNHRKTLIQCVLPWTALEQYASHNASSLAMTSLLLS